MQRKPGIATRIKATLRPGTADLPDVHFGAVGKPSADWRKVIPDDAAADADEMTAAPPDVIEMLGFDPFAEEQG